MPDSSTTRFLITNQKIVLPLALLTPVIMALIYGTWAASSFSTRLERVENELMTIEPMDARLARIEARLEFIVDHLDPYKP